MNAAARLGLYALGLVAVFGVAAAVSSALAPEGIATEESVMNDHSQHGAEPTPAHSAHTAPSGHSAAHLGGLALAEGGYALDAITAPTATGEQGTLSFRIVDEHGEAVTAYETEHDKELHLIVVRTDGSQFRHVHPELAADGTWSIDWAWQEAGSYRVYVDFAASGGEPVTLSRTVQVAGDFRPVDPKPSRAARAGGYDVELSGDLVAGTASDLTVTVSRDGEPVTTLQPYLGAYGHLVALRQGDLGYAHVHPGGEAPHDGDTSGPEVSFAATVPTPGRYLLYFDFQIDGAVHSVPFVVDATH